MQMTKEEFDKIRPLQWNLINYGSKVYNTVTDATSTRLFWLDFFRYIFAPNFAKQQGITRLTNFDLEQPVLITNDLKLEIPSDVATILYFAKNDTLPMKFSVNVTRRFAMIVTIILMVIIVVFATVFENKLGFEEII